MNLHLLLLFSGGFTFAVTVPVPHVAFAIAHALKYGIKTMLPSGAFGFSTRR